MNAQNTGPAFSADRRVSLREYVLHAEKFGGYTEVFETAVREGLPAEQLAALALSMGGMARQYRSGQKRVHESFSLPSRWRTALIRKLLDDHEPTQVARMLGCSRSVVSGVQRGLDEPDKGSSGPETGGKQFENSDPGMMTLRCAKGHLWTRAKKRGRPPLFCPDHA